jgi:hypothetical protein
MTRKRRGTKALKKERKREEVKKEKRRPARQMTTKTTRPKPIWRMPCWMNCEMHGYRQWQTTEMVVRKINWSKRGL